MFFMHFDMKSDGGIGNPLQKNAMLCELINHKFKMIEVKFLLKASLFICIFNTGHAPY